MCKLDRSAVRPMSVGTRLLSGPSPPIARPPMCRSDRQDQYTLTLYDVSDRERTALENEAAYPRA